MRGTWMGNRGCIHRGREIVRPWATRRWITCALEYKGWVAPKWVPNRWTALFFGDEAVALAAGHRPCALCRRDAYRAYLSAAGGRGADEVDLRLDAERRDGRRKRLHAMPWRDLPAGTFVEHAGAPHLVLADRVRRWHDQTGYTYDVARPWHGDARVLTPPTSVLALQAGYPLQV